MSAFRRLILLLIFASVGISNGNAEESPIRVRMAFWNIEWFPGNRPRPSKNEIRRQVSQVLPAIEKMNPDVMGMEEILDFQAARLAVSKSKGNEVQVCSDYLDEKGNTTYQQTAIASRLPTIGAWWEPWNAADITPRRGFSFAAFQPAPGQVLLVYVVHLKSNRGELLENIAMREESARQLARHVRAMEKAYATMGQVATVIGGDFNTSLDDPRFENETTLRGLLNSGFTWAWDRVPLEKRITLPGRPSPNPKLPPYPDACFDQVLVRGAKVLSCRVMVFDPEPSDHRPVVVEIELPPTR